MNGSSMASKQMDDFSPPTSPVVKGVIEKPDSVLEMDDDTPEAAASKMVKRAGSFRSVERSPSTRRQLSGGASAINTSLSSVGSGASYGNGNSSGGPNPLSQSMSATTVKRHSSDVRTEFSKRPHSRTRSKSVSVKGTEPVNASASKLNSGERLDMQSLPTHASVHDLKKKFHEIQESAGEAMVSGTNSEDESYSASSDDACSASTSSAAAGSTSSLKSSHISLEDDVILFGEIISLNGTPMEDSWSDDTEIFDNGSTEDDVILFGKIISLNRTPMEDSWSDDTEIFDNGSTVSQDEALELAEEDEEEDSF